MSTPQLPGIHHVTAIAGEPQQNLDFYTGVLGLRLVKLTINFDDPGTYHLYFGNEAGSPGSILTFFPWPRAPRGIVGNGQVTATAFAVAPDSVDYWRARLEENGAGADESARFGERVLSFTDPDGLPLEIIASAHADAERAWKTGAVPPAHAFRGFHSATLSHQGYESTAELLHLMGFRFIGEENGRFRFETHEDFASIIDLVAAPDLPHGRLGVGTVHHIAFRTADEEQQLRWRTDLLQHGYNVTPVADRKYFRSIYYREPGGVLFEIATDPPGFAIDEPLEHLGEKLMLPEWLESQRSDLLEELPRLTRSTGVPAARRG
jgi:glyoxalase family protein